MRYENVLEAIGNTPLIRINSLAKFAPNVARRHFEDAKWADPTVTRAVMITSMSV